MKTVSPAPDADTLALMTLAWVLQDDRRAERLLSLTGLTPDLLRSGLADVQVQLAVFEFLTNHEADLLAAADALDCDPVCIIDAHAALATRVTS
ncbi:DUF3572 family protein [Croceicoccus sp. F390]|uniref:DUF3572 family protein n=1 Tax=Croceicoccus esteveae TaxID=3075597 RepID=A0ABU2ZIS9_9SPHN|nr:DUF3572 family protein [Croceicoccus sp. F390]MDT0576517.1 DUF3572 family protein [Croceicoccus sp. F390]